MTETKKQIQELKKALPGLKEKVIGVALLLCLSLVMIASVSYAWVTMSTSPELGGVKTTVAANGALEIALSDFDGQEPEDSAVGDSMATEGQTAHGANITWGNLVNLSEGYGVDNLVLRPAKLDLTSPNYIYSMKYGQDGRVVGIISDFGFTTWQQTNAQFNQWNFVVPPTGDTLENGKPNPYKDGAFGVRAISSVTMQGEEDINVQRLRILADDQLKVKSAYESELVAKYQDDGNASAKNQSVLSKLVNRYVEHIGKQAASKMSGVGALVKDPGPIEKMTLSGDEYLKPLTEMMETFYNDIILPAGNTMVYTANLQSKSGTIYTLEDLVADDLNFSKLLEDGVKLTALGYNPTTDAYDQPAIYIELYKDAASAMETLKGLWTNYGTPEAKPPTTFYWGDIDEIVEKLVGITTLELADKAGNRYVASKMVNMGGSKLLPLVTEELPQKGEGPLMIYLQDGMIVDFEKMSGASAEISVTIDFEIALSYGYSNAGRIIAEVDHDHHCFGKDYTLLQSALKAVDKRTMVAAQTYGMVLDLWVRTNSNSAMLTLNGTPEVVERQEPVLVNIPGHDAPRKAYIYSYLTGEVTEVGGVTMEGKESLEVYEVLHDPDDDGTEFENGYYYYHLTSHEMVHIYEVQEDAEGNKGPVATDQLLYLDPDDVEALVQEKMTAQAGTTEPKTEDELREEAVNELAAELGMERKTNTVYDVVGFTAANRIWQENDDPRPLPAAGEISTTQGSGSCYIFTASSTEEYENTKNLLKNLRLVFLDENGKELSRARLDTEKIYAESGKYTVPIYLESGKESITVVETDEEGNEKTTVVTGLCRLEKNVARRISVVVYLEGENLTNDMVMSKDSVSGSLNLQFDSTADLHSVGDTELLTEMVKLTAALDVTSMEYTGQTQYSNLTATITGLMPQRVEATFARMYNATQGTMCDPISLEMTNDGWTAAIPFNAPGRYVLKALTINGVDYALQEPLEVNISGFNIKSANFDTDAVLTVEKRTSKRVSVHLASDLMPSSVVAQFVSVDASGKKSFVNADLQKIGELWEGNAAFTKSGQYKLTNLIMDGEIFELPEEMQQSFVAYLGLTADVVLMRFQRDENDEYICDELGNYIPEENGLNYDFEGPKTIDAFVQIYDDAGNPMSSLGKVALYYKVAGSSNPYGGFSCELSWNGTEYAGTFPATRAGRFVFGELQLRTSDGLQHISFARTSSTLSIRSKEPPAVVESNGSLVYYDGKPYYKANITNAEMAGIWVVMSDGVEDRVVEMSRPENLGLEEGYYVAQIPDRDDTENTDYNANGNWTIKSFLFNDVYVNGTYFEGDNKHPIDIEDRTYTVAHHLIVTSNSLQLGGTSLATATGAFMTPYDLGGENGLQLKVQAPVWNKDGTTTYVDVSAYEGRLSGATIALSYDPTTDIAYGGYDGADSSQITVNLTSKATTADSITYKIPADTMEKVYVAGKYAVSATVKLLDAQGSSNGKDFAAKSGNLVEIYSKPIEVWIAKTSLTAGSTINIDANKNDDNHTSGIVVPAVTRTEAVVYYSCSSDGGCTSQHNTTHPRVFIQLSGLDSSVGATATLAFTDRSGTEAHLYAKSPSSTEAKTQYTWTSSGECSRYVGTWVNKTGTDDYTTAGTITANTVAVAVDGHTYTFAVATITIHNPSVQYVAGTIYDPK